MSVDPRVRVADECWVALGKSIWSNVDPDEYIRELRAGWSNETAHAGAAEASARESFSREPRDERLWERIVRFQREQFKTSTGLPFTLSSFYAEPRHFDPQFRFQRGACIRPHSWRPLH